jgi:sugar (pentulose or hexulose) kinase
VRPLRLPVNPMGELLLGIDVGTTWCKAAVVTPDGQERAQHRVPVHWQPVPTGAEIEPQRLPDVALAAAGGALDRAPDGRVVGVGVTSMAEAGALIDAGDQPVAPAIAWHDRRGGDEAAALADDIGATRFTATTGLPPSPLCTLVKYRWLRGHDPAAARGVRWLNVAEWVVRGLGGEQLAELSLASRTGMLDLDRRAPWEEALDWAGAPRDLLPEPAPAGTPAGRLSRGLTRARGAVLCVAGHDHDCAAVGAGAVRDGDVFDSCGTAEAFVRAVRPPLPHDVRLRAVARGVTVGWHVIPERNALLGAFESGLAVQRLGRLLGMESEEARRELDDLALTASPAGDGAALLDGRRDAIRGDARPEQLWRAALEALAERGAAMLDTLEELVGPAERIVVTGGGVRSEAALATRRAAFGALERPAVEEAAARGAALLAGCAAGIFDGVDELPAPGPNPIEAATRTLGADLGAWVRTGRSHRRRGS